MSIFANKGYEIGGSGMPTGGGETIIAQGVRVEGEFVSDGNVLIEGEVRGTVTTSQHLGVGERAHIVANIQAGSSVIAGQIEGNLNISGRLELKSTSRITGDIIADDLVIESGAVLNGAVRMKQGDIGQHRVRRQEEAMAAPAEPPQA